MGEFKGLDSKNSYRSSNSKFKRKKIDYKKFIRNSGSIKKSRISLNSKKPTEVSIVNKVKVFSTNFKNSSSYLGVSWVVE
jgi:hypothetical protein